MISYGRSDLQSYIEEYAIVLERLLQEVPRQIKLSFCELEKEIEENVIDLSDEEADTMKDGLIQAYRLNDEDEMLESFYKSMVIMINCYCETTLLSMLPTDIQGRYRYKDKKIDRYYKEIQKNYDIKLKPISEVWKNMRGFVEFRNDIIHSKKYDTTLLTIDYLDLNLKEVKRLLRTTADAISCLSPDIIK